MKIKWFEMWNNSLAFSLAFKFPKSNFNYIKFAKWIRKASWWAQMTIIFSSFIPFSINQFPRFLFCICQLAIDTENLFDGTVVDSEVFINYVLNGLDFLLIIFYYVEKYAYFCKILHHFVNLLQIKEFTSNPTSIQPCKVCFIVISNMFYSSLESIPNILFFVNYLNILCEKCIFT